MRWLLCCAALLTACATSSTTVLERAATAQRQGDLPGAYAALADASCGGDPSLEVARQLVELWDELGRPATPTARLHGCNAAPVVLLYVDGLTLAVKGEHAAAAAQLERAEALAPAELELPYRRALVLIAAGDGAAAGAQLERLVAHAPARVDLRLALAQAQVARQSPSDAVTTLRGVLRLRPSAAELRKARAVLNHAVRAAEPPLAEASAALLKSLLGALERGEARADTLEQARALWRETGHPRALTVTGLLSLKAGSRVEAHEQLAEAAALLPLDPDPVRALGISLHAAERPLEALPYLKDAVARDPFDGEAARMLASAALARGDVSLARDAYEQLTVLEPTNVENHLWLARLLRQRGDLAGARLAVARGCELTPRDVPLLLERAAIEAQLYAAAASDSERAAARARTKEAVEALLDAAPEHPAAASLLESVQLSL